MLTNIRNVYESGCMPILNTNAVLYVCTPVEMIN